MEQFQTIRTKYFVFYFTLFNEQFAKDMARDIDGTFSDILCKYHIPAPDVVCDFYICDTVDDYIVLTGKTKEEYQDWMTGFASQEKKRLCLLHPDEEEKKTPEYYRYCKQIMVHEITHLAFDSLVKNENEVVCWLAEGIAILMANQTEREYISGENYPLIADIDGKGDCDAFYDNGGYDYAGIYVAYFLKKYGVPVFLEVYTGKKDVYDFLYDGFELEAVEEYFIMIE